MTTTRINSIKKVRELLNKENNINKIISYYNTVESLMYHYKKVLNTAKEMEAKQLLSKIRMLLIEKLS
jgi:hypothetical protein